jgi:CheY-like chemotaxis protein
MQTILIVDDDRNLRTLYKAELEGEGYRVFVAQDGRKAIDFLETELPDIIVMDIRMPEMDGLEAMARVLKLQKNIPVILNTAYSSYLENFSTWAAEGYVVKSSDLAPLKEKIRETFLRLTAA